MLDIMSSILREAAKGKSSENKFGILLPKFRKRIQANVLSNLNDDNSLPHPVHFYLDLFGQALHLLFSVAVRRTGLGSSGQTGNQHYRELLESSFPAFMTAAIDKHREKNSGSDKYSGTISFQSSLLTEGRKTATLIMADEEEEVKVEEV